MTQPRPRLLDRPFVLRRYHASDRVTTIELRQRLPPLLLLAVLLWHIAAPTAVTAVALALLGGVLMAGLVWTRALALGVAASRRLHYGAVQVGDALEEHLTLENTSWLPALWAEFDDRSDLPGYALTSVRAVAGRGQLTWRAHAVCAQRGLFTLGPWQVRLGDPFGLFLARQVYAHTQTLLVYPALAPLPPHLQPHAGAVGDHRRLRQPWPAHTLNATTTRAYVPGDSLRHIHWPTTARRSVPHTKVFEPEATATVWLLPDFDQAAQAGEGPDGSEETMVLLAASLADHLLRRGLAVGLLAYTDGPHIVRPQRGRGQLWPLLRGLAPLHASRPLPLAEALGSLQALLSGRDRLVVITPTLDAAWPRALRGRATRAMVECRLLDPASFAAEAPGELAGEPGLSAAEACAQTLAAQGVPAEVVRRGDLQPAEAALGERHYWEFVTVGTGRAVARRSPRRWSPESELPVAEAPRGA